MGNHDALISGLTTKDVSRFWSKVSRGAEDECWPWQGGLAQCRGGYGRMSIRGISVRAHRIAFAIASGRPPRADLFVIHSCDTPRCCNPSHLSEGAPIENSRDMTNKGRQANGERQWDARLTAAEVADIRALLASGEVSVSVVARRFGVTPPAIRKVRDRVTWRHVA